MSHIKPQPAARHYSSKMTRQVLRLLAPVRAGLRSRKSAGQPAGSWCALTSRGFASDADLQKTPLYDFHVEHGGKHAFTVRRQLTPVQCDGTRTCLSRGMSATYLTYGPACGCGPFVS